MKKYFIILILTMTLSSCNLTKNDITESSVSSENDIVQQVDEKPADVPVKVLFPNEDLVYKNEIAGYQFTFPESWRGHYVITEHSSGEASIGFYGESKTGRISQGGNGLSMFQIIKSTIHWDGVVGKIGEINGTEYFHAQRGGFPIGILYEISIPAWGARETLPFEVDETELALAAQDWEKAKEMYGDIDDILKTFKAIE